MNKFTIDYSELLKELSKAITEESAPQKESSHIKETADTLKLAIRVGITTGSMCSEELVLNCLKYIGLVPIVLQRPP